ncbi:MAG: ATP-binding protein [Acidobacteriia bacterium]|nr:ATP-binding protein [Terriglobia bacterium]
MPKRLVQKLILALTILVVVVEGVAGLINMRTQERQLLNAMILGADQLSKGIASATWHAMLADRREAAYEVMQTIALKQGISRIRMFNHEGRVMFSTAPTEQGQVDKTTEVCSACHIPGQPKLHVDIPSRSRILVDPSGRRRLAMFTPIYNEPSCSQAVCHAHPESRRVLGVLDVALNLDTVDREVAGIKWRVLLVTGVQILLMGSFIVLFARRFVEAPIRKLIEGTRAVSDMKLDQPITIDSSEELGELARSFNVMRDRLRQAIEEINQFTQSLETKVEERTEQLKTAHERLMKSDRLASLGQLAASVAHEINNPISGVLNLAMLMQRILKDDGVPPDRLNDFRKYLSQVITETSRVGRIVSDLLAFSRRSKPQHTNADLNKIVKTTLSLVDHKLKLNNVAVSAHFEEQLPPVSCDASQIQQVVMNLILNGAEATQPRGSGRIAVTTQSDPKNHVVALTVSDNGEGIRPEHLSKVFDPFFTTKEEGKGVGLGLAVVYGIVESHGGDIEVKSTLGEGTSFRVTLPLSPAEKAPVAPAEAGAASRR